MQIDVERQRRIRAYMKAMRRNTHDLNKVVMVVALIFFGLTLSWARFKPLRADPFTPENQHIWLAFIHSPLNWQPVRNWYPFLTLACYLAVVLIVELPLFLNVLYRRWFAIHYGLPVLPLRSAIVVFCKTRAIFLG